ncbi:MAG: SUMF1/EgtB/PvdO family nonheme iron enzyme, partial [bacterium]
TDRPITYVNWFDAARFANWMANGRPTGAQGPATTENGAYALNGATRGVAPARNAVNPNTGGAPTFALPTEDQWYKAAYYSPSLDGGTGGYYLYATQSDDGPGNTIGSAPNQVNYIDDFSGSNTYSVTQKPAIDATQNYLTDVGYFRQSPSHYGAFDLNGNVYAWNDLDGTQGVVRGLRGGFGFAGPPSLQSTTFAQAGVGREANDTGIRVVRAVTYVTPAAGS